MIREKVLHLTRGRNSSSVAIVVDSMKRDEETDKVHIKGNHHGLKKALSSEKAVPCSRRSEPLARKDIELMLETRSS